MATEISLVQPPKSVSFVGESVASLTLDSPAQAENTLIAVLRKGNDGFTALPSGWKLANFAGPHGAPVEVFYKRAMGGEQNITFSLNSENTGVLAVLEYSGIADSPLGVYARRTSTERVDSIDLALSTPTRVDNWLGLAVIGFGGGVDDLAWSGEFEPVLYNYGNPGTA